jgi:hypothetical protein
VNAIHARSQLRYSPTAVDLEILEKSCESTVMLTWLSRASQEKWDWDRSHPSLVLAERAVADSPRSTRAVRDRRGLPLRMKGENEKNNLTVTVLDKQ